MINKRPFGDEDSYEVACKHQRQLECTDELSPAVGVISCQNITTDDEGDSNVRKFQDETRFSSDLVTDVSKETYKEQPDVAVSGSISQFLLVNSCIAEDEVGSEPVAHLSFFPGYFEHGHHLKALLQSDEMYSSPVDYPPRKPVSIGPEHQACVPEWDQSGSNSSDPSVKSDLQTNFLPVLDLGFMNDRDEVRMMGTCVIPMPGLEASPNHCFENGGSKNDCSCLDKGSVCCVKQHITEAREKLRENIGQELFEELGFCEMGEDIAKQWTEDEEHTFLEVVLSNPASLGKNFWDHLPVVLPSRTHKELVSYYFNVFMLRKRGEQNRFDPLNIDSDNDEWQKNELQMPEDDEDSVVESPINEVAPAYYQEDHLEECHGDTEERDELDACKEGAHVVCRVGTDEEDGGDVDDVSGACMKNSPGDCGGDCETKLLCKIPSDNTEDYDIQDDSCTSYEYQRDRVDLCGPLDEGIQATDVRNCSVE
ncbi:uncharacterized protein LOC107415952 isoform X1 [Ziziphus jujuba]|uniref:Uncharacterized protein LOC107415952 isoform X1 n=1 Tax=Ziziphus jujuba TaxID=326968 RepID=A0ABM3IFV9_ZIZJJ|nr:uncharacterized protein LOC107415952 isoform X1 [Ziziphus jujuba]XP_048327505.2 uncharacterized protein LOC107415952 isoform X1 [Ziziphus jujuba]XP_048327506.2 uncharacterized protein LOC107415952 isoform X1 [Ziziphus jujuba]